MNFWLGVVIAFFVGALVGRYFEKIIGFVKFMQEDLRRAQEQATRGLPKGR